MDDFTNNCKQINIIEMELNKINFNNTNAQKIYENYLLQIQLATKKLSKADQQDILMELNSHIYESFQKNNGIDELSSLINALEKIGIPNEVLKPLIADKKLSQATKTFNPIYVLQALALNISNGVIYSVFAILYMLLFGFIFLIIAKISYPSVTGFFYKKDEFFVYGLIPFAENKMMYEVLGNWFIPVTILLAIFFYLIITALLKFKGYLNKNKNQLKSQNS